MAEEIVGSWNHEHDLIVDLAVEGGSRPPEYMGKVAQRLREASENPLDQQMVFTFEDADGNQVRFPLRLVSNTTFEQQT